MRMHKKFVDETYPHINSCIVLPLAAKQAEGGLKPYDMRDNDLIFTASYTDPDMVYFKAKKQDSENVDFFNTFTQRLFDNPELTQEEAIRQMYPGISWSSDSGEAAGEFHGGCLYSGGHKTGDCGSTYKKSCACEAVWT